ncbi:MAG: transposase [Gammaproteobacteria bacterium]
MLEMVDTAVRRGVRFGAIAVGGGYGKEPTFLRELDGRSHRFMADVHCDQRVYEQDPAPVVPERFGWGRRPRQAVAQTSAVRVDDWAAAQPATAWRKLTVRQGERGKLAAEYLHAHVWVWDGREAQSRRWHLLVRREVGAGTVSRYCLSNASDDTPLEALARLQAQRYFIEHSFREAKTECGLADYQVRRWDAWHHHMALVMLGTLFLVKQKRVARQRWPMLSLNDLVTAMAQLLPRRSQTAEAIADVINRRHRMRQSAQESCVRRSMAARE